MKAGANLGHAMEWLRAGDLDAGDGDPRGVIGDEALNRRARLFHAVFRTSDGQAVLQTILEASLFRAPVDHRLGPEEYLRFAQIREGENKLAAVILAYIDHAEQLERHHDRDRTGPGDGDGGGGGDRRPDPDGGGAGHTGPGSGAGGDPDAAARFHAIPGAVASYATDAWDTAVR
ncbi:MAG TPA: hypothetical protein VFC47_11315 [Caulobacteraceae bacterium]|nr:hypothetical protein [Caulobacteraceae bacterium]